MHEQLFGFLRTASHLPSRLPPRNPPLPNANPSPLLPQFPLHSHLISNLFIHYGSPKSRSDSDPYENCWVLAGALRSTSDPHSRSSEKCSAALCPCRQWRWYISSSHLSFVLFSVLVFCHIVHHVVHHVDLRESLEVLQKSKGWIPGMEYCEKYCGHPFQNSLCSEYQFLRRCMRQGFLKCNARLAV